VPVKLQVVWPDSLAHFTYPAGRALAWPIEEFFTASAVRTSSACSATAVGSSTEPPPQADISAAAAISSASTVMRGRRTSFIIIELPWLKLSRLTGHW